MTLITKIIIIIIICTAKINAQYVLLVKFAHYYQYNEISKTLKLISVDNNINSHFIIEDSTITHVIQDKIFIYKLIKHHKMNNLFISEDQNIYKISVYNNYYIELCYIDENNVINTSLWYIRKIVKELIREKNTIKNIVNTLKPVYFNYDNYEKKVIIKNN